MCAAALHSYLQLRGKQQHPALWISSKGQPLQPDTIKRIIIYHCRGAGVHGTTHAFRRTMTKSFLMNGGNAYALQALLGHSDITMTVNTCRFSPPMCANGTMPRNAKKKG